VAAPAEIAEGDRLVRVRSCQSGFPGAVALFAFDQRAADQHHAVAVLELKSASWSDCHQGQKDSPHLRLHRRPRLTHQFGELWLRTRPNQKSEVSVQSDLIPLTSYF